MENILITGGLGYIGSHTAVELLAAGHNVIIVDNLCNTKLKILDNIKAISGKEPKFYQIDVNDTEVLTEILASENIDSIIHFAALKSVGQSILQPTQYYQNNIDGLLSLIS